MLNRSIKLRMPTVILMLPVLVGTSAYAAECPRYIPANAWPVDNIKLCQSGFHGQLEEYACRDYGADEGIYTVLYKGGASPRAITYRPFEIDSSDAEILWVNRRGKKPLLCQPTPPADLPRNVNHLGTGVRVDENGRSLPCTLFEHTAARAYEIRRFFVYYNRHGAGPVQIDTQVTAINGDALVAELAYQLGLSLLDTECCRVTGEAYLDHARQLFPNASAYQTDAQHNAPAYEPQVRGHRE